MAKMWQANRIGKVLRIPARQAVGLLCFLALVSGSHARKKYCQRELGTIDIGDGDDRDGDSWDDKHDRNVDMAENDPSLLIYGDSITEHLSEFDDALEIYRDVYSTEALGIGGDRPSNLLWRLQNGEFHEKKMKFVVIMIGINSIRDLHRDSGSTDDFEVPDDDDREERIEDEIEIVEQILAYIFSRKCRVQVFLHYVLPMSEDDSTAWPNQFTPTIDMYNYELRKLGEKFRNIHNIDCTHVFLEREDKFQQQLNDDLYQDDLLHINEEGHQRLARCALNSMRGTVKELSGFAHLAPPEILNEGH
mmetsp:Transcript_34292/g.97177  ORF Transcript_34292/g.97177 Transcript_34292/m.97177 type:complete len:305 (-) Transcript_34292:320-1234(-)